MRISFFIRGSDNLYHKSMVLQRYVCAHFFREKIVHIQKLASEKRIYVVQSSVTDGRSDRLWMSIMQKGMQILII